MKYKLLVCDLDNTLYDWVDYFVIAFYEMVEAATPILGCDSEQLLDDLKKVHQQHHDSEHPFALLETSAALNRFPGLERHELLHILNPAFHAFNSARKRTLKAYPDVHRVLDVLKAQGLKIVAHTESRLFSATDRLRRLELEKYFNKIYCREASKIAHPTGQTRDEWLNTFPHQKITELTNHQQKPDPSVLLEICSKHDTEPNETIYVGDSMSRDMLMAKSAGVFAAWAKYGTRHTKGSYEKLVRVTHWTTDDVEKEIDLRSKAREVRPDLILENSFAELLQSFK